MTSFKAAFRHAPGQDLPLHVNGDGILATNHHGLALEDQGQRLGAQTVQQVLRVGSINLEDFPDLEHVVDVVLEPQVSYKYGTWFELRNLPMAS